MCADSSLSSDGDEVAVGSTENQEDYTHYVPAHSDFLIHWTGCCIDSQHDPDWYKGHASTTDSAVTSLY